MKVGLVGLGRMGAAIGQRLNERGCDVVAWDRNPKAREVQGKRGLRVVNGPCAVADEAEVVLSIITEDKACGRSSLRPMDSCRARSKASSSSR
jgi:3-hydroxyisobutyrate dehydrogenase